jgi:Arc/MetJ family transcription regulator
MTRTNIDIDDDQVAIVMRRYRLTTKTEAVDMALRRLAGQPLTIDEALAMRGGNSIEDVPSDQRPR